MEEDEEEEEDEQEGGTGRRDRAGEKDVGREWVDTTNLKTNEECNKDCSETFGCRNSMDIRTREKPRFPALIYNSKMSWNPKHHKISTVGSAWSNSPCRLAPKKPPHKCTSHQPLKRRFQSPHPSLHHRPKPNAHTLRLYQLSSLGASAPVRPDDSVSQSALRSVNHLTIVRRSHDDT